MTNREKEKTPPMAQYLSEHINGRLVIRLRDISHTMRQLYEGKGSQRRILIILSEAETMTQRELTGRLGIQSASASEAIAKLEELGLLTRSTSQADRRTADISLTEEGRRQAAEAMEQRQRRHEEMFSALTEEEKTQLLTLLDKIGADWEVRYQRERQRCCHPHGHHHHHRDEKGRV